MKLKQFLPFILTAAFSSPLFAQDIVYGAESDEFPKVEELNWLNYNFLNKQRKRADDLTREHYGKRIRTVEYNENTLENIALLQRLVNDKVIEADDKLTLQSLGVVMGDIYVDQVKSLEWKVYEDDLGKSHAVCVANTKHCIFPMTMLSRRMQVGLQPDVQVVYQKGLDAVWDYLPKLPFSD